MTTTFPGSGIPITLDGTDYTLRLDFTACMDFEKQTGKNALKCVAETMRACMEGFKGASLTFMDGAETPNPAANYADIIPAVVEAADLSVTDIAALFWACLGGEDSDMTVRQAGRLATVENIREVGLALWQAVQAAMPKAAPGESSADSSDPTNLPTG